MDPWSKGDYSRIVREASMVVEKVPVVILPSGRVPGRVLLALPILEARRRRNRDAIVEKGSRPEVFETCFKYTPKGGVRRPPGCLGGPTARPRGGGGRHQVTSAPGGPPPAELRGSGRFRNADFLYIFSGIFMTVFVMEKPEIQKQQKTETGTGVH